MVQILQREIIGQSALNADPTTASGIPRSLIACFQEYDIESLDPAQHQHLIIERVLAYGDRRELHWLFTVYGRETITSWVQQWGIRRLPWRRYNLWCVLLGLGQPVRPKERQLWRH